MLPADIASVLRVQAHCYLPDNIESEAVIRARLAIAPDTAWVVELEGAVCAYLVGYRSRLGQVGALGDGFEPAEVPDCLYLHDLAVGQQARGLGLGPLLVAHALSQARREGLAWAALVSVQGSRDFWRQRGFAVSQLNDPGQALALSTYAGGPACYMTQALLDPGSTLTSLKNWLTVTAHDTHSTLTAIRSRHAPSHADHPARQPPAPRRRRHVRQRAEGALAALDDT